MSCKHGNHSEDDCDLCQAEEDAYARGVAAGRVEERERCANLVPTNWCDPLLTGGGKVIADKTDCPSIEALLQAVAARIRGA